MLLYIGILVKLFVLVVTRIKGNILGKHLNIPVFYLPGCPEVDGYWGGGSNFKLCKDVGFTLRLLPFYPVHKSECWSIWLVTCNILWYLTFVINK